MLGFFKWALTSAKWAENVFTKLMGRIDFIWCFVFEHYWNKYLIYSQFRPDGSSMYFLRIWSEHLKYAVCCELWSGLEEGIYRESPTRNAWIPTGNAKLVWVVIGRRNTDGLTGFPIEGRDPFAPLKGMIGILIIICLTSSFLILTPIWPWIS